MNYVVQNYLLLPIYKLNISRMSLLVYYNNLEVIIFFWLFSWKLGNFLILIKSKFLWFKSFFFLIFNEQIYNYWKFLNPHNPKHNLSFLSNYNSSLINYNFIKFSKLVVNDNSKFIKLFHNIDYNFNQYKTPVLISRFKFPKRYYNQSLIFIFIMLPKVWLTLSNHFYFYLNHIFSSDDLYFYRESYTFFFKTFHI